MKNRKHQDHFQSRRNFLCRSACASLGVTSIVNTLAHLKLTQSVLAQSAPATDYKAMVCLFLYGGNDANNMLMPLDGAARTNYESARPPTHPLNIPVTGDNPNDGTLALGPALKLNVPSGTGGFNQTTAANFGVHPALVNVQGMFNSGDLGFVANVGTLVDKIDRTAYLASPRIVPVPPQLFSHSDQQMQWQSSIPDQPFQTGWGGRAADVLTAANANPSGTVSMNISISGQNSFEVGDSVVQYSVSTGGIVGLAGYNSGTNTYGAAVNYGTTPPTYVANDQGRTLKALDVITKLARMQLGDPNSHYQHHLEDGYNDVMKRARDSESIVGTSLGLDYQIIADAFDTAFGWAGGTATRPTLPDIANQLKMVARLIQGRTSLGNNRQIFFVSMTGFDTHQNQCTDQNTLLGQLDKALKGFKDAINNIDTSHALWNETLLLTHSDFARTLQPNGSTTSDGSDHGWGGHQIVMGGPIIGGQIYGSFPDLARNSGQDVDSSRGRWIPTTAVDQYASVATKWFMSQKTSYLSGITDTSVSTVFPNLSRFQAVNSIPSNLGFVDFNV